MSIGSDITALNRRSSASPARAAAEGADSGKKPLRLSLLISRSIRLRSFAEEKPHQEGDAYISDAMVVALATSCIWARTKGNGVPLCFVSNDPLWQFLLTFHIVKCLATFINSSPPLLFRTTPLGSGLLLLTLPFSYLCYNTRVCRVL